MPADGHSQDVIIKEFKPREVIVAEGAPGDRFFVIMQGNIEILQNNKSIRYLKEGDVFGVENHYLNKQYTTTALSITRSRVAAYHTSMIKEIIYDRPQLVEQILSSVMHQLEQTTQVAEENISLENVIELSEKTFYDGDVIIREGTDSNDIYYLVSSERGLQVTKQGRKVGFITQPGEFFGEMSTILNQKRTATVTSLGKSTVQIFSGRDLAAIFETYPQLSANIINALAKRLNEANKLIVSTDDPVPL